MEPENAYPQHRALRITLEYKDGTFHVLERQLIAKRIRQTEPLSDQEGDKSYSGFWFELRDGNDQPVYRQVLFDPVQMSGEIHTDDKDNPIYRVPATDPSGVINLLMPDLPEAVSLVLVGSPLKEEEQFESAREMARFEMKQLKEGTL